MCYIINYMHAQILRVFMKYPAKSFPDLMQNYLTISKSGISRTNHCSIIVLSFWRIIRGAGKLFIQHFDIIFSHCFSKDPEIICGDLVSETSGATVNHHEYLIMAIDTEYFSCLRMKDSIGLGNLKLKIMVSRTESSQLVNSSGDCFLTYFFRICSRNPTPLFNPFPILFPAVTVLNAPVHPFYH